MKKIIFFIFLLNTILVSKNIIPKKVMDMVKISHVNINTIKDLKRNQNNLRGLSLKKINFKEGKYHWRMLLVTNNGNSNGPFWFLPHDDENTAFDAAIYAVKNYGGGFLSILSNDKRYYKKQDPNRNFADATYKLQSCKYQYAPSPIYTKVVSSIIEYNSDPQYPYMTLHNNENSWRGGIGKGGVSILTSSKYVQSYTTHKEITSYTRGLKDEDSLIYIAGNKQKPNKKLLNALLSTGMNVKYEVVNKQNNDCSLSNYVILNKPSRGYFNIETEHGDLRTQKIMIKKIIQVLDNLD